MQNQKNYLCGNAETGKIFKQSNGTKLPLLMEKENGAPTTRSQCSYHIRTHQLRKTSFLLIGDASWRFKRPEVQGLSRRTLDGLMIRNSKFPSCRSSLCSSRKAKECMVAAPVAVSRCETISQCVRASAKQHCLYVGTKTKKKEEETTKKKLYIEINKKHQKKQKRKHTKVKKQSKIQKKHHFRTNKQANK